MAADSEQKGGGFIAAIFLDIDAFRQALTALLSAGVQPEAISILGEHQAVSDHFGGTVPTAREIADRLDAPREPLDEEHAVGQAVRLIGEGLSMIGTIGAAGLAYAVGGPVGVAVGAGAATETKVDDVLLKFVDRAYTQRFEESIRDGGLVCWVNTRSAEEAATAKRLLSGSGGREVHAVTP